MAARYWRLTAVAVQGALVLSELRLCGVSGPVDADAIFSCSALPLSGTLAALRDDSTDSFCGFSAVDVRSAGFRFAWDFQSPVDVVSLRIGASSDKSTFPAACTLESSSDGLLWSTVKNYEGIVYPGDLKTVEIGIGALQSRSIRLLMHCDGADGSSVVTDDSLQRLPITVVGAKIGTAQSKFGGSALRLDGAAGHVYMPNQAAFRLLSDFTLASWVWVDPASTAEFKMLLSQRSAGSTGWGLYVGESGHILLQGNLGSVGYLITATGLVQKARWHHVAVSRNSGVIRIFLDGIQRASASASELAWATDTDSPFCVGFQRVGSTYPLLGWVDEIFVADVGLYTGDFPLPVAPYEPSSLLGQWLPKAVIADVLTLKGTSPKLGLSVLHDACPLAVDTEFGGRGFFYGSVSSDKGKTPLKRRVRLFRSRDSYLVRETWSAVDGKYRFEGVNERYEYDIEAWDHEKNDFTAVANNQLPEVAP